MDLAQPASGKIGQDGPRRRLGAPHAFAFQGLSMAGQIVGQQSRFGRQRCHDVTPNLAAGSEAVQKDDRLRTSAVLDGIREWKHENGAVNKTGSN
jgi:hypothetical protein